MAEAYGATRPPDDRFAGVAKRASFLIDPQGVVRRVYEVSDVQGHPDEVLGDLRAAVRG